MTCITLAHSPAAVHNPDPAGAQRAAEHHAGALQPQAPRAPRRAPRARSAHRSGEAE